MKRRLSCFAGIIVSTFSWLGVSEAFAQASSDFEQGDVDGWTVGPDGDVSWVDSGGNPAGFLRVHDWAFGDENWIYAPQKFCGDWSVLSGGSLSVDVKAVFGTPDLRTLRFEISGPGGSARHDTGQYITFEWVTYGTTLEAQNWQVLSGTWDSLLADVRTVRIEAEFHYGDEAIGFDNIRVAAVSEAEGIVSVSDRTGNKEVWRMDAGGGGLVQLTFNPGLDAEPVPSPDGQWIAYISDDGNPPAASGELPNTDIWIMRPDGSGPRRLTFYETGYANQPAWSPDSLAIAFACQDDGWYLGELRIDLSAPPHDLASGVPRYNPEYRPIGSYLLHDRDDVGAGWWNQWYLAVQTPLSEWQLTSSYHSIGGGYSHDGNKIAYIRVHRPVSQVRVMDWDGTGDGLLWENSAIAYDGWGQVAWSPDDTKIAVSIYPSLYPGVPEFDSFVQVLDATTGEEMFRTFAGKNAFALESSLYGGRHLVAGNMVWNSDGSKLVFMSNRDGDWEIYSTSADGTAQINLTNSGAWDGDPAWIMSNGKDCCGPTNTTTLRIRTAKTPRTQRTFTSQRAHRLREQSRITEPTLRYTAQPPDGQSALPAA